MATWEDVRRIASALPGTAERLSWGQTHWTVKDRAFVWERPLRRADYEALGDSAPEGAILGVRVPDLGVKEALLSDDPAVFFTTPHFDGYPSVLVLLEEVEVAELEELMVEAWLDRAPKRLAKEYLKSNESS
jgi:hypothetical protein